MTVMIMIPGIVNGYEDLAYFTHYKQCYDSDDNDPWGVNGYEDLAYFTHYKQ